MYGSFNEEAQEIWDFARCQRPDGSFYGTRGKCRKGSEVGARVEEAPKPRRTQEKSPKVSSQPKQVKEKATSPEPASKKPEGPVYKVRSEEKKPSLLQRLKDKIRGKAKVGIDLYDDKESLSKHKDQIIERLKNRNASKKQIKDVEKYWNRLISAAAENRAFADRLESSLPRGFKTDFEDDGIILTKKTKSGDKVVVSFSPSNGFHFNVNGTVDAGTVKNRRAQLEVAMSVRDAYNSVVKALPEGAIIKTAAWGGDGKGEGRKNAYVRLGFSKPEKEGGDMFAVKLEGNRMAPANGEQYDAKAKEVGSLWFAEKNTVEEVKTWLQAVFGNIA